MKSNLSFVFIKLKKLLKIFFGLGLVFYFFMGINSCTFPSTHNCEGRGCEEEYGNRGRGYRSDPRFRSPRFGGEYSDEAIEYFLEIGFGAEYMAAFAGLSVRKWQENLRIKLYGDYTREDEREVERVADELSDLTGLSINLNDSRPNVYVHFLDPEEDRERIQRIAPKAKVFSLNGLAIPLPVPGLFGGDFVITEAMIFIDEKLEGDRRKSVLREELTQSLGLLKDSYTHPDSIFHHRDSPTEFLEIDREVISLLYDERIEPGMTKVTVMRILR